MITRRIALLGFGEVGAILGADLAADAGLEVHAWDIRFGDPASAPSLALCANARVRAAASAQAAVAGADLVISAVTAAEDLNAARAAAAGIADGCYFLDLNSVAPQTRIGVSGLISAAGGRYVEGAVMSPVPPRRIAVPILLGGPWASGFLAAARVIGFSGARAYSADLGRASAAKMCRSVVVKGMEALLTESMLAARHYGVEAEVLASLADLFLDQDWSSKARYMISRSLEHGVRRAEEMHEVSQTVRAAGLDPHMSEAAGCVQRWAAQFPGAQQAADLPAMLDEVRAAGCAASAGEKTC
ncbi:MAG: DUF1932 domain-containing protein [Gammaproteobacteria bacterium]|nr:DUF1932 domain-containing protein [Gammaproteobacteria bacterium]